MKTLVLKGTVRVQNPELNYRPVLTFFGTDQSDKKYPAQHLEHILTPFLERGTLNNVVITITRE